MNIPVCLCPHAATPTGLTRSGWSSDCLIHRQVQQAPLSFTGIVGDDMGTRIPQYAELATIIRLQSIVERLDKRLTECERDLRLLREQAGFA